MEFLGIGPLELFFILIIALIVLGPQDMAKAGRTLGRFMRKTVLSPTWINMQRRIRALPYEMMREAGLEEEDLRVDIPEANLHLGLDDRSSTRRGVRSPARPRTPAQVDQKPVEGVPEEWLGQTGDSPYPEALNPGQVNTGGEPGENAKPWIPPEDHRIQPPTEQPEDTN